MKKRMAQRRRNQSLRLHRETLKDLSMASAQGALGGSGGACTVYTTCSPECLDPDTNPLTGTGELG